MYCNTFFGNDALFFHWAFWAFILQAANQPANLATVRRFGQAKA
jgi:hypothetical protein